jgi:hypothetical protein
MESRAVTQLYEEIMKLSGILPTQFTLLVATRTLGPALPLWQEAQRRIKKAV